MAPHPKIRKAFDAMRALGIKDKDVTPVLKNLLKLYDKNWELIEEENYRTLADAIFEYQESKKVEDAKEAALEHSGSEPPPKRPHLDQLEDHISSTKDNSRPTLVLEEGAIPPIACGQGVMESSQPCLTDRAESHSRLPHAHSNEKGKVPIASHSPRDKKSTSERVLYDVYLKPPRNEHVSVCGQAENAPGNNCKKALVKTKTEQSINELRLFPVPTSMVNSDIPGALEGSSTGYCSLKSPVSQYLDMENKDDGSACTCGTSCQSNFDIASSTSGKVKISLNCDSAIGQPNFHIPNLDAVLKVLEDKYIRSYKVVRPPFSVMKLLKELCETYLHLGIDSNDRSAIVNSHPKLVLDGPGGHHRNVGQQTDVLHIGNPKKDSTNKKVKCLGSIYSSSSVVAQKPPFTPIKKGTLHKISDITKGAEKVKISLVDQAGCEHLPNFFYIPQNTVYQSAYLHFSLARIGDEDCCPSCVGDCLSMSIPCACARESGGEFAYTQQGLLKENFLEACISMILKPQRHHMFYCQDCPLERSINEERPGSCKGHLMRKFIKECWQKCGCSMQCGNRVVQRGITCNLQVFLSEGGKGWGVRTLESLPKGAFVCEYVGEILTNIELYERNKQRRDERHTYPVLLDADWGSEEFLKDEEALCLDATLYGNVARFINHRCFDSNLLEIPVAVETPDRHYYHLAFFTKREVDAFEELTWDYGIDFDDLDHPVKAFQCCCGSSFCRNRKQKGTISSPVKNRCSTTGRLI